MRAGRGSVEKRGTGAQARLIAGRVHGAVRLAALKIGVKYVLLLM